MRVLAGGDALTPPDEDEREVLEMFGDGPEVRLCCQLVVSKEVDEIVLALVDD